MNNSTNTKSRLVRIVILSILSIVVCIYIYDAHQRSLERSRGLRSFAVINIGLMQQKENTEESNMGIIHELSNQTVISPKDARIKNLQQNALEVGTLAKELNDWIEEMKIELVATTDGCDQAKAKERVLNPLTVVRKGNSSRPTHFFGTDHPPGTTGKAHELKDRLEKYREKLLSFVVSKYHKEKMKKKLSTLYFDSSDDAESAAWEMFHFYDLPLSAALVELTRWQIIVRSAENEVLGYFLDQTSATSFKFDAVMAVIVPKSTVVNAGSMFEADVILAAYSTHVKPLIIYGTSVDTIAGEVRGGVQLPPEKFSNGRGHISIPTSGTGTRTCAGVVRLVNPVTGQLINYTFSTNYQVK